MRRGFIQRLIVLTLSLSALSSSRAATPEEIDAAIAKGIAFLKTQQKNGNWELRPARDPAAAMAGMDGGQFGGRTALVTYALLAAGEKPNDPQMAQAIEFLLKTETIGSYATGMRAQNWLYLPRTGPYKNALLRDMKQLGTLWSQNKAANNFGLYDYGPGGDRVDLSASQYGVLGMWAAANVLEVPSQYWKIVDERWKHWQQPDGGWAYAGNPGGGDHAVTPSMTAAGVATLFITQDFLNMAADAECRGNATNPAIERGIALLGRQFPRVLEQKGGWKYYTLYGIERVGVASGYKFIGDLDWYEAGADHLVKTQDRSGWWPGDGILDTSFSILFLARGREPVLANKLKYTIEPTKNKPVEAKWNQRNRDIANLARFLGKETERRSNWQIIDLDLAKGTDLLDAPIAYISGTDVLKFGDTQKQKLRDYVEAGGMLVFQPDCTRRPFINSAVELCSELFPKYEARRLPNNHPIYTREQFFASNWKANKVPIRGVSNGVRELAIILEGDVSRALQEQDASKRTHFELMTNIYLYAIDKSHALVKGKRWYIEPIESVTTSKTLKLARLETQGNWDPEPGGWRRISALVRNENKIDLQIKTVRLGEGGLAEFNVAHLTGTEPLVLSEAMVTQLKEFIAAGGTLLIDATGGNANFKSSIEKELAKVVGDDSSQLDAVLPSDDVLYTSAPAIKELGFRQYAQETTTGIGNTPQLRVVKQGGRNVIFYSREDLTAGIVGNHVDGVLGYTPESATQLVQKLMVSLAK